jgi:solute carrier family 29 (equilibrative nucleoside transporter), member 1/2/3
VLERNDFANHYLWQHPGFKRPLFESHPQLQLEDENIDQTIKTVKENISNTQGLLYSLTFVFVVTLLLFPGVTNDSYYSFLQSEVSAVDYDSWYQLTNVFLFNVFDTIGRWAGRKERLGSRAVNFASYLRIVFIGSFLLTDFRLSPLSLWDSDWFKLSNLFLFAFSNGFISTQCAIKAPACVETDRKAQVGAYVATCNQLGVLIGSILQVGMTPILARTPKVAKLN